MIVMRNNMTGRTITLLRKEAMSAFSFNVVLSSDYCLDHDGLGSRLSLFHLSCHRSFEWFDILPLQNLWNQSDESLFKRELGKLDG